MTCEFCSRDIETTFHHLVPKTLHSKKWFKKNLKEKFNDGVNLCRDCHDAVHRFIPEKTLGTDFNTKELLLSHPKVSKFVAWVSKRAGQHSTRQPDWYNRL